MGEWTSCPNCGNSEGNTDIWKCDDCRTLYCDDCGKAPLLSMSNLRCPKCDSTNYSHKGEIEDDE